MIKAGLTGSIGMGKSTTAAMFRDAGVPVYDADATVHDLYKNEAVPLIENAFPGTTSNGAVDRQNLGAMVLGDADAIARLEALIHPLVHQKEREFIDKAKADGETLVILDIPLLFEVGGTGRVDKIIVVTAPADVQRERVMSRPGMTEEKFLAIRSKQMPDSEKRARADYIIDTSKGIDAAREAVIAIISNLKE